MFIYLEQQSLLQDCTHINHNDTLNHTNSQSGSSAFLYYFPFLIQTDTFK